MQMRFSSLILIGILAWSTFSVAADIKQKYGLELRGGFGIPTMEDVNNVVDTLWGKSKTSSTKPSGIPSFGVSLLYRSYPNFQWEIGYNAFAAATWKSENTDTKELAQMNISGSEFFILPTYLFDVGDVFRIGIGAGPNFSFATASRTGAASNRNFVSATGRTVGGMIKGLLEISFNDNHAIAFTAGYRNHYVDRIRYENENGDKITVPSQNVGSTSLPIDYSGIFAQIGWRFYFIPEKWTND
ncbi:MAG: hypothetical protein N2450_04310 [bacterium]|nr:hypothetical protein [bacterium]